MRLFWAGAFLVGGFAWWQKMKLINSVRGLRNNNAGNIERNDIQWQGMAEDQSSDSRFVVFESPEWGIRAMNKILNTYAGRGLNSVRSIISTWAPPIVDGEVENNTAAYVDSVSKKLGVLPDEKLLLSDRPQLIAAIIHHENGIQPYSMSLINRGVSMS